jgi:membrane fusion protein (multidrug efflux system)
MNRILNITLILSLILGLSACGGEDMGESLAQKRKQLEKLQGERVTLDTKIADLEKEIGNLDTVKREIPPVPVKVSPVALTTMNHYLEIQGSVESNRNIQVSPKMSGIITQIYVSEGQYVSAGKVLAQIDDAVLKASRAELETQADLLKTIFEKQKRLWDQEIGTEIQYLQAKNNYDAVQKRLSSLDEQIAMSKIKAPISGTVDDVMPKVGEMATPGMPAFRVTNSSDLSLVAKVSEAYAPYVKRGDAVNIYFPAIDKTYKARVTTVSQSIDPISRTFEVKAKLPADKQIKINMYGKMAINDRNLKDVIVAPVDVLQKGATGNYVYIAEEQNGKWLARRRSVDMGLSYENQAEITSGLQAGDRLITDGFKEVSEGQVVSF